MLKENQVNIQAPPHLSDSLALPIECQRLLKQCQVQATKVCELTSGIRLARLVNKVFFNDGNQVLKNKIITQNQERKGNNVINLNIILKEIKNNSKIACPPSIAQLTTFKLIDSESDMITFVNWVMQSSKANIGISEKASEETHKILTSREEKKQNISKNITDHNNYEQGQFIIKNKVYTNKLALQPNRQYHHSYDAKQDLSSDTPIEKQQNIFENVFFLDQDLSPPKQDVPLNDSLQGSQKVVKKGSFQVLRPKTGFSYDHKNNNGPDYEHQTSPSKLAREQQSSKNEKNQSNTQAYNRYYSEDEKQSPGRKTIPKINDRPPLYRKLNKEQTKTQVQKKHEYSEIEVAPKPFAPESNSNSLKNSEIVIQKQKTVYNSLNKIKGKQVEKLSFKNQNLINQISRIEDQIKKQSSTELAKGKVSQTRLKSNTFTPTENSNVRTKSNRKLFKIDIKQVKDAERKSIVEWLISINLLNSVATNYFDKFHQICKNGVIFPEIINHQKGRSGELYYFKNPVKSAEVHSNYQKVFSYLKELPNFESQLLFMYDYFVPEALQSAFWSLLKSCQNCFQRSINKSRVFTKQSEIRERLELKSEAMPSRIKTERNQLSKSLQKQTNEHRDYQRIKFGSTQKIKASRDRNQMQKSKSVQKQNASKRKSSLDFIKELPQNINYKSNQLVQSQQPVEVSKQGKGYRELHELKKNHNLSGFMQTPQKKSESSISRSRIVSTNSMKKMMEKVEPPSISLQMQMKALKYLKQKGFLNVQSIETLTLFEDPIRNGVLFNKIIGEQVKLNHRYTQKPRNIIQCRENFKNGFSLLRSNLILIPSSYETFFEEIIKGEMNIFYGLVWHVLNSATSKANLATGINGAQNAILNISKNFTELEANSNDRAFQQVIFWLRSLEQDNLSISQLQIRDSASLIAHILSSNLLYKIASSLMAEKYTLRPTYQQPINPLEQESNLKKILSFLAHNKILKSELVWKSKSLVKRQKSAALQIMKCLMIYHKGIKKPLMNIQLENPIISFGKYARQDPRQDTKALGRSDRLETTMANNSLITCPQRKQSKEKEKKQVLAQQSIEVPWMRSIGFTGDLSLNNGVILCRLIAKLTMQTLSWNQNPTSKAECLTNIRKCLKLIDKFKWDEEDVASADEKTTLEIYKFLRQKYKHSYCLKDIA